MDDPFHRHPPLFVGLPAQAVSHCGDIIDGHTIKASLKFGLPLHVVHGNNLGDILALARLAATSDSRLYYHGRDATLELIGRRIFVTHYPHCGHAMARTGDYDLVCCGHSHVPEIRQQANIKGGSPHSSQARSSGWATLLGSKEVTASLVASAPTA